MSFKSNIMNNNYYNIPLSVVKKHLNINDDFTDDDSILMLYLGGALTAIERHIDTNLDALIDNTGNLPTPIIQATLLLVGTWYANRESVAYTSITELPLSFNYLMDLYKDYSCKNNTQNNSCNCN